MPRSVEPAPPQAAAALSAALDAMGFDIATPFQQRGNVMADPSTLAAAAAYARPRRTPRAPRPQHDHCPVDSEDGFTEAMRRHLADINSRLLNLGAGLDAVDSTMAATIAEHLESIGLDDLNPNRTEAKTL